MRPILFLILLCGFTFPAAAQVYKWVDAQGQSHYSDNPPLQSGKNIEQKKLFGNHIETDTQPFETKEATKKILSRFTLSMTVATPAARRKLCWTSVACLTR